MSKIYYLMGKSSTGKDTIYKELRKRMPQLKNVTIYTTRPRREGRKRRQKNIFLQTKLNLKSSKQKAD